MSCIVQTNSVFFKITWFVNITCTCATDFNVKKTYDENKIVVYLKSKVRKPGFFLIKNWRKRKKWNKRDVQRGEGKVKGWGAPAPAPDAAHACEQVPWFPVKVMTLFFFLSFPTFYFCRTIEEKLSLHFKLHLWYWWSDLSSPPRGNLNSLTLHHYVITIYVAFDSNVNRIYNRSRFIKSNRCEHNIRSIYLAADWRLMLVDLHINWIFRLFYDSFIESNKYWNCDNYI